MDQKYILFIQELKQNIIQSRYLAARVANQEQLLLYLRTGKKLSDKINQEKWGANVIGKISEDLQTQLPGLKGFSTRNLQKMRQFYSKYCDSPIDGIVLNSLQLAENQNNTFTPTATAQIGKILQSTNQSFDTTAFFSLSFSHHILILDKCANIEERMFYINNAASQLWSLTILEHNIESSLFKQHGQLPNNFANTLPNSLKPNAAQIFKDEYLLDFMGLNEQDDEKYIEFGITSHIKDFILRMGKGFSFIGNQYRLELAGEEFFVDLLFFNRYLQCLVAFELKKGKFKPAYAGQLNFYLNVLDKQIKLPHENSSIGIVLCKEKNNTVVEYSVKSIDKAMGVATYKTTKQIPEVMKNVLPDTDQLANLL